MGGKRQEPIPAKQSKGLIRALNRSAVRDDKSPQVVRKSPVVREPSVCARCGAVFARKTWRHDHALTDEQIGRSQWTFCPACLQVARQEGQGRLLIRGAGDPMEEAIRRRIKNVAARAAKTQPERRIVSVEARDGGLEILTTSQKLAHRLAHELKKAFGGRVAYAWSDDGSLFATWDCARPKTISHRRRG